MGTEEGWRMVGAAFCEVGGEGGGGRMWGVEGRSLRG